MARLELGAGNYTLRSQLDNKNAVGMGVFQSPGANAIELSDAVRAKMAELEKQFPQDMAWSAAYDPTVFVRDSISAVVHTLLEAVLLVVLVVILFLQTWRARSFRCWRCRCRWSERSPRSTCWVFRSTR
ncbi:RND superfamily protein MexF [Xanthomonas arboricola pv. pruni str. MAFF 311562]|uniref:RND superfamily protein MexF n=1 Tax=Xanthomonas arboricola pv. pruni str. MAFF 311562 TaxID=1414836 RepID=W4RYD6_9XANT|nr:RND superfamily protein MexF [Xanthomonas arboricola pv. pruni str. MAFF 311562]